MADYAELVKNLRITEKICRDRMDGQVMLDAADAIEQLQAECQDWYKAYMDLLRSANPFATDVWTNKTVTVDHVEAKPFGNGIDFCPVCGKPSTIGKPMTNADRIRSMSDEELADFLDRWEMSDVDYSKTFCNLCDGQYDCHDDCLMDWLKAPVKEVDE